MRRVLSALTLGGLLAAGLSACIGDDKLQECYVIYDAKQAVSEVRNAANAQEAVAVSADDIRTDAKALKIDGGLSSDLNALADSLGQNNQDAALQKVVNDGPGGCPS